MNLFSSRKHRKLQRIKIDYLGLDVYRDDFTYLILRDGQISKNVKQLIFSCLYYEDTFLFSVFLTVLNCYNVKWVTKVTDTFSICKVLALVVIIVFGVVTLIRGNYSESIRNPFYGSETSASNLALSFYSGLFSFAGW